MSGVVGSVGAKSGVIGSTEIPGGYEEGTFTPVVYFGGSVESMSGTAGIYTKIGNIVNYQFRFYHSGSFSNSGNVKIAIPFATSSTTDLYVGTGSLWSNLVEFIDTLFLEADPNFSFLHFSRARGDGVTNPITSLSSSNMSTSFQIRGQATYTTN